MHKIPFINHRYQSEKQTGPVLFPSVVFYLRLCCIVLHASRLAKNNRYHDSNWVDSSYQVLQQLEKVGVHVEISGIENVMGVSGPAVIIGNHMSMMETFVLPAMVQPVKPVTFVVKETLLSYPVFKYVMRSRKPIAVTRTNPR
jgi:1-acyl-sn-glycerol-3-phosphate acyltransferase